MHWLTRIMENERMLLVDDDRDSEYLVRQALSLEAPDIRLDWVEDGKEAIDYLQRKPPYDRKAKPRVMLLDLKMPRVDGFEVLEWLKRCPELRPDCVIVCTTSTNKGDCDRARELGADGLFVKPLSFGSLREQMSVIGHYARSGIPPGGEMPGDALWFRRLGSG